MPQIAYWIRAAGAVQLGILAANFWLPGKLECRKNLGRVTPMIRNVFIVHWAYILLVLGIFSAICFLFPGELAGGSGLGRFLCGAMALFWLPRIPIQLFVYDADLRRRHRLGDAAILVATTLLIIVFGAAALRAGS